MSQSYRNLIKVITLFGGVQGLNILLNLVRTKLAALILGPSGIGLNSIFNEMRELIHTSTNIGMDVSSVRHISRAFEEGDETRIREAIMLTRSWLFLFAMLGALLCMVLAEPLSWISFSDSSHTWDFVLLAPSVAFSTLSCGEMAILKGLRRIRALATISVLDVVAGIVTTIPVYYFWGMSGIVPALVLLTCSLYLIAISYSYRHYPLHLHYHWEYMKQGLPMLAIGIAFVLAGMVHHGAELAIRSYLNHVASLHTVGLYSAGFTVVMTYGGIVFASLENDYFPRLSGIITDITKARQMICKQVEVLLMLLTPLLAVMIVALPIAVPLLFSKEFNEVIPMAQVACLGLLFKGVYQPFGYVPLAAGDSKGFLALELVSYAFVVLSVIVGYHLFSLIGAGMALAVSNCIDVMVTLAFVRWKYGITMNNRILIGLLCALTLLSGILAASLLFA